MTAMIAKATIANNTRKHAQEMPSFILGSYPHSPEHPMRWHPICLIPDNQGNPRQLLCAGRATQKLREETFNGVNSS
jgi:hypothetical protein